MSRRLKKLLEDNSEEIHQSFYQMIKGMVDRKTQKIWKIRSEEDLENFIGKLKRSMAGQEPIKRDIP